MALRKCARTFSARIRCTLMRMARSMARAVSMSWLICRLMAMVTESESLGKHYDTVVAAFLWVLRCLWIWERTAIGERDGRANVTYLLQFYCKRVSLKAQYFPPDGPTDLAFESSYQLHPLCVLSYHQLVYHSSSRRHLIPMALRLARVLCYAAPTTSHRCSDSASPPAHHPHLRPRPAC